MLNIPKTSLITLFLSCLFSCTTNGVNIPNHSVHATIQTTAPKTGSFFDNVGLGLAGPIVCETFFFEKHAVRKATPILNVSNGKTKSASIPAGKDMIFVVTQNIGDKDFYSYWEMYVKHNSVYEVKVTNTYIDQPLFGKTPKFAYEIYEDGRLLPYANLGKPQPSDCE